MPGWWSAVFLSAAAGQSGASFTSDLSACCSSVGASSCPPELFAVGPGSKQVVGTTGMTVSGGWNLRCEAGVVFDPSRTVTLPRQTTPRAPGTVLGAIGSAAAACFDATCSLPEGLCLKTGTDAISVVACGDGGEPSVGMWSNPSAAPRGGRVLGTAPTPVSVRSVVQTPVAGSSVVGLDTSVPPAPPSPCVPSPALREPSNAQVDQGNDAIVRGDFSTAVDRYRAAITINRCNAFAWAALGDALLQTGNAVPARSALQVATALMPSHFHAWTRLGEADERIGDRDAARAAFLKALESRPGHPPAAAGLARTR